MAAAPKTRPVRFNAKAKASASEALETTLSSTPRCTIVCAICGLMPHDAIGPHQPRGGDRLEEMLGNQRVDGGNAGNVDDRDRGLLSTIAWSRFSITTWVRISSVSMSGTATISSQSLTTGSKAQRSPAVAG